MAKHNESSTRQIGPKQNYKYGPVAKLAFAAKVARIAKISRAEQAIVLVLADMADAKSGIAWPSFNTLAKRTSISSRHAKRAIKKLENYGLITIVEAGTRVRSNRYCINMDAVPSDIPDTTEGGDMPITTVVTSEYMSGDMEGLDVVTAMPPESIHSSEHQASDEWERSQAEGGAPCAPALRPSLARQPGTGSDRFPEFWEAVGRRTTVAESEQLIAETLAKGVAYKDILDGARRWTAYNAATGGKRKATPLRWLQNEKWRDDWAPPARAGETREPSSRKPAKTYSKLVDEAARVQTDYIMHQWHAEQHAGSKDAGIVYCAECLDIFEACPVDDLSGCCPIGLPVIKRFNDAFKKLRAEQEAPHPDSGMQDLKRLGKSSAEFSRDVELAERRILGDKKWTLLEPI
jgi:hypothetical protein